MLSESEDAGTLDTEELFHPALLVDADGEPEASVRGGVDRLSDIDVELGGGTTTDEELEGRAAAEEFDEYGTRDVDEEV